ncbi:YkgJ family cysteine cluster protein [Methanobacterium sp.]|uniref:YkgJ family cysteine cluster protein n=1 Tax=Methanobacterium sp. TaxID=2164 RepID=UPI003C734BFD
MEKVQLKDIRHNLSIDENNRLKNGYHAIFEGYKFIQTKPCKYLDEKTDQCRIYGSRPKNYSCFL